MERRGLKLSNGFLDPRPKKCVPYKAGPWSGPNRTSIFQEYGPTKLGPSFFLQAFQIPTQLQSETGSNLTSLEQKNLAQPNSTFYQCFIIIIIIIRSWVQLFFIFYFFREYLRKKKETHVKSPNKKEKQRGVWEMHWSDPLK